MISPSLAPPQGGEVLSAGRARGQAAQGLPAVVRFNITLPSFASVVRTASSKLSVIFA